MQKAPEGSDGREKKNGVEKGVEGKKATRRRTRKATEGERGGD